MVSILLQAGAEANPPAALLGTPLQVASCIGDMTIINLLVKHPADINSTGGGLGSVLIASLVGGQENVIMNLLDQEIDVNIR